MQHRPRLDDSEFFKLVKRREQHEGIFRLLIISDLHGILLCKRSFCCLLEIIKHNYFDEIIINGDLGDWPYLSNHVARLWEEGVLRGYSEINEAFFIRNNILNPITEVAAKPTKKKIKPGNHDERITKPKRYNQGQLERLLDLQRHFNTVSYAEMLGMKNNNFVWDDQTVTNYYGIFDVTHGLNLAKNSPEKNIYEYMNSGSTGHTHRANIRYITNARGQYAWFESACLRTRMEVEYFPTGKIPDWQNGFTEVTFDLREEKPRFHGFNHLIIDGSCVFDGIIYDGKSIGL